MTFPGWLFGFFYPACGVGGAAGLPVPQPMDMAHIERAASPNNALVNRVYAMPAARLYDAIRAVARARPDTFPAAEFADRLQVHYVVRSAVFNFPDLVTVQVSSVEPDASTLTIYARSVYGYSDFGANRKRIEIWLAALSSLTP